MNTLMRVEYAINQYVIMNCESVIIVHLISVKTAPTSIEKITSIPFRFVVWNVLEAVRIKHELITYM
jgi:hypothetical protein